ncbi:MAG: hypothetical protein KZQ64_03905 [gamma proteobacterium symbiont of Bathyaustriella thionipta]|nr:hypothetical protein [gamma proteobacterium symbiont of Bathyaustriella thionipta]MCU7949389.1 hypothetical protein [gamma proteobacterium symbiont of Bathyaustriella thionipta]MCU7952525.1 hypothetical protein [gamma proteobacterium symbiont of Bathyaustriella thionipta]MCU7955967.1 hypothetical protein [gamma proteobacterium symbiont of Bathyaustriella thionipta]MCU7968428.1 hypothetical protein [gamma proteobacterium symbiont of Bathyaustriella thionipta]
MYKRYNYTTRIIFVIFILFGINKTVYSANPAPAYNPNLSAKEITSESYQNIRETITALDITRRKYQRKLLIKSPLSSYEKEYLIFIDYLSFQINNYCSEIIKNYGEQAVNGLPCYSNNHVEAIENYEVKTSEEKIDSLDNEFMTALGEFDEMLLNEEEKVTQIRQNKSTERNNASSRNSNMNERHESIEKRSSKKKINQSQSERNKDNNSGAKGKNNKQSSQKRYKRKKLDEIDDDIVARQLKEAAEKEKNPELKEKLWDEYYKYKQTMSK